MSFDGTFYFTAPINGRVTGAVFIGDGKFTTEIPPNEFEKDNVKRLLGVDVIESDFKTAVLRFSDDTAERLGKPTPETASLDPQAQRIAREHDARILKQTGANLAARRYLWPIGDFAKCSLATRRKSSVEADRF